MKTRSSLFLSLLILWGGAAISLGTPAEMQTETHTETQTETQTETPSDLPSGKLRQELPLNDGWSFALVKPGGERSFAVTNPESPDAQRPGTSMVSEETLPAVPVRLPHDWGILGPFDTDPETWGGQGKLPWRGVGWYSRSLTLTKEELAHRIVLDLGGCMAFPEVYVNGIYAGGWDYGYLSFQVDLTPYLREGENSLAVRCDTRPHGSRWYPGAGIYRPAKLLFTSKNAWLPEGSVTVSTPEVVLEKSDAVKSDAVNSGAVNSGAVKSDTVKSDAVKSNVLQTPSAERAVVEVRVCPTVSGRPLQTEDLRVELFAPDGSRVTPESLTLTQDAGKPLETASAPDSDALAKTGTPRVETDGFTVRMTLREPALWDVTSPSLYRLRVVLPDDELTVPFGIRTFQWTADDGFHLNGRRVQLYGVNLHHDQGILGAAAHPAAVERQLKIMKEMGVNAIRTSHDPSSREFLDLCDQLGLIVWNELFDKWNATADLLDQKHFDAFVLRQVRRFTERDRNHPCVCVWSIGNEIWDIESDKRGGSNPDDDAQRRVTHAADCFRKCDPTRPVGLGCFVEGTCGPENHVRDSLDLTGWNYGAKYREARVRYPQMPLVYTESASALSTRGFFQLPHPRSKETYDREAFQVDGYDLVSASGPRDIPDVDFFRMETDRYVAGEFVWTGFDYLGEPTPFDREARSSYFGIVDLCGLPKDRYFLYRSYWAPEKTTVHLLPHWNWEGKQTNIPVYLYTNGDSAELFLNGKSLGCRTKVRSLAECAHSDLLHRDGVKFTASSEETKDGRQNTASAAFDSTFRTRWCASDDSMPQWLQIDLGKAVSVWSQELTLERKASEYRFRVEASLDGTQWKTVFRHEFADGEGNGDAVSFHAGEKPWNARFFRIFFEETTGGWASVREWTLSGKKPDPDALPHYYAQVDRYRLRWENVPYVPGTLEAVAYRDGKEIGRTTVRTAGEAAELRLTPDLKEFRSDDDLIYVQIEAVDENGTLCPWDDRKVTASVTGPAELVGIDAGNPMCFETIPDAEHSLFFGKAVLVLRSQPGNGDICLEVRADGLKKGVLDLKK